jgi:hypothetical protein
MTNTKMKDAEPPRSMRFELATVVFDDGSSSAVLESSEMEMRSSSSEMTKSQRLTLNTYVDAAKLNGELGEDGRIRLHIDHWRPEFYASHTGDKIEAKRKAFSRGREKLVEMNILEVRNDVYTLLDDVSAILLQDIRRASDSSSSDEMDDTDWREQDVVSL